MTTRDVTEDQRLDWAMERLCESVGRLAAPPDEQLGWLKHVGSHPSLDELALEFDEAYALADELAERGRLTLAAVRQLAVLNQILDEMSDKTDVNWVPAAIAGPEWQQVRRTAKLAAAALAPTSVHGA